jgi:hypothetical protein
MVAGNQSVDGENQYKGLVLSCNREEWYYSRSWSKTAETGDVAVKYSRVGVGTEIIFRRP